jgi:SAM-dependent methyltransferase
LWAAAWSIHQGVSTSADPSLQARHIVVRKVNMKRHPQDLQKIAYLTLEHYNQRAEEFWEATRGHYVSQNIEALLQHIEGEPPFTILDFGCGPGRDLKVFAEQGHIAIGLEGAVHFAAMARAHSGCEVWQQDFLKLELPEKYFDGVFANANVVSCSEPGATARVAGTAHHSEIGWCAV